ncbi:Inositol 1,4,5-trisphosphate receptor type 2 [Tetrabaena socialis]|uniref:Inositol 1,4,5-trisphosphate receptor type 2 n=1 Tax=Tetrabaena socialis TaxID=47790 RepID=A0A2J8AAQ9_9CHLO|nr:Inositol 1,4,5-trisphosphate receptor type 2 [Tetrabaena socialis]|eukprot:PNH09605.1 Inositol 1,4,5-trisphosphate receptor type 2 [Tetrabaena socialis]
MATLEDLATRSLKYGDTVYFKVDGKQAFVSAHDRQLPQVRVEDLGNTADSPPDLKDCLFEVTKKLQYTVKKVLISELARHGVVPEDVLGEVYGGTDAASAFEEALGQLIKKDKARQKVVDLFQGYLREKKVNDEEFQQVVGESVLYGQPIQLRHVATDKYVTIKRTAAEVERGALKVVLEEGGNEGSWFQVSSGYRTKPEGARLMPGEVVVLKGLAFTGNGLHISTSDISDPTMLPVDKHPYIAGSKEVSASPDVSAFKVIPFSVHEKVLPTIRQRVCGMNSVSIQDLVANSVYINFLGAVNEKELYFESPLTRPDPNRIGGPDTWRMELVLEGGKWCGMPVTHKCKLRIRHLPTGTYLAALSNKAKDAAKALRYKAAAKEEGGPGAPTVPGTPSATAGAGAALPDAGANPFKNAVATDEDVLHDEAFRLVLTKRYNRPETLWELQTFSGEDAFGNKLYAFFKHVETQFWLSGAGPLIPQPPSSDPDEVQEKQFYPVVHPEKLERNVMYVVKVPDHFTAKVLDLQRATALFKDMYSVLKKEKVPTEDILLEMVAQEEEDKVLQALAMSQFPERLRMRYPAIKRSLRDLVRWLDRDSWDASQEGVCPAEEYQMLLRELGLIDLVVQYMEATRVRVFASAVKLRSTRLAQWVIESGKQCHKVLQLACNGNEVNQAYLSRHASMVMSHLALPLTAPDTMAAMYEDNMEQMQTVSPSIVAASVNLIRLYGHKPRFLEFLRQICGTRERPMPSNQNWIVAEMVGSGRDPLDVFCTAGLSKLRDKDGQMRETWVITCRRADDKTQSSEVDAGQFWGDMEDLTNSAIKDWELPGEDAYSPRELFIYYCYSLKFIVSLCYGRNSLARGQLLQASREYGLGLEFDSLLRAVSNDRLPYAMRAYMVQAIRALYINVEPYRPLKLPRHVRMMSKAGAIQAPLSSDSGNSDNVNQLINAVLTELKEAVSGRDGMAQHMTNEDGEALDIEERAKRTIGRNTLMVNLLKSTKELFELGMMALDSAVTQDMLTTLLLVVQQLDSLPLTQPERFERGDASKVVMEAKKTALRVIEFALDMKSEQQCAAIFDYFARWQRSPERQEYWAQKQTRAKAQGNKAISAIKAAGGFLSTRVRAAAALPATNKVSPAPGESPDPEAPPPPPEDASASSAHSEYGGVHEWVDKSCKVLEADNEENDFPLFKLDSLSDQAPFFGQGGSPVMKLLDLVRYEDQELTAKTFQMLERLTNKREKLVHELLVTFVVTDDDLIQLSQWAIKQMEIAQSAFNFMGSLVPEESTRACAEAAAAMDALTSLLVPMQQVTIRTPEGAASRVFVSKVTAANCQYLMADLQVHTVVLKFLKLPLKRVSGADPHVLQEAEDLPRQDVFRACLQFLRHFMVVGDMDSGSGMPSRANQAVVLPSLELLLGLLDIRSLPTSDTIIALFIKNSTDAAKMGEAVIKKLFKLIIRYGDKEEAGWLELLSKVVVVDGTPIKRNQLLAMQLITESDADVLALMTGETGLDELKGLLGTERLTARPDLPPPVGRVAYHTACVQLLAECCFGKEPEQVVKSSGYMSLAQVLDVLLLQPTALISEGNLRYVQRAYWRLLQHCYFATDTDNTKVQVRNGTNRIWPLENADGSSGGAGLDVLMQRFLDLPVAGNRNRLEGAGSSLMQTVVNELDRALADPSDALGNADSATAFVATAILPALKDYFENHWHSHSNKIAVPPTALLTELHGKLAELYTALKRLKGVANSSSVKSELKAALANTRALLAAMPEEANTTGRSFASKAGGQASAPSMSQHTAVTSSTSQKVIQQEWGMYVRSLSSNINVEVDPDTNAAMEVLQLSTLATAAAASLGIGESIPVLTHASSLRLARLFIGPFGRLVPNIAPLMCFEDVLTMLLELLATRGKGKSIGPSSWEPRLLVKLVGTVCAAAALDDGCGALDGSVVRHAWARLGMLKVDGEPVVEYEEMAEELRAWRQGKFDKLGATRAAITLLAHPLPEVQLEAMHVLEVLLEGGNKGVQTTIHGILSNDCELCDAVFANIKASFERCRKWVAKRTYRAKKADGKAAAHGGKAAAAFKGALGALGGAVGAVGALGGAVGALGGAVGGAVGAFRPGHSKTGPTGKTATGGLATVVEAAEAAASPRKAAGSEAPAPSLSQPSVGRLMAPLPGPKSTADGMLDPAPEQTADSVLRVVPSSPSSPSTTRSAGEKSRATITRADSGASAAAKSRASITRADSQKIEAGKKGPGPVAEANEDGTEGGSDEEDEDEEEEETQFEQRATRLNEAGDVYKFNKVLLDVLKLMVEGHNKSLQLLLQSQPQSTSPIDLVVEAVELLNVLQHLVDSLENELLLLCKYMLKLQSVTPTRDAPLKYIRELFNGADLEKMEDLNPEQQRYAQHLQAFLMRRLGYVEINWNGLIEPCYFNLTPECSKLVMSTLWNKVTLDRINNTVSPDSRAFPTVKAAELVEVLADVVDDIELEAKLTRNKWLKVVSFIAQYKMRLLELTFYLAVSTLIFQALADARWGPHTSFDERGQDWRTIVLSAAVMLQSTCTVMLYLSFVYTELNKHLAHEIPKTAERLSLFADAVRHFVSWALRRGDGDKGGGGKGGGGKGGGVAKGGGGGKGAGAAEPPGNEGSAVAEKLGITSPPLGENRGWLDFFQSVLSSFLTIIRFAKFWYFNMLVSRAPGRGGS